MRKKDDTMREFLLCRARNIVSEQGPQALNMRTLAKSAGVAVGSVYNYFSDKDDLLLTMTEEYWNQAMEELASAVGSGDFTSLLGEVYTFLRERFTQSGFTLMRSLRSVESAGRGRMNGMLDALRRCLLIRLAEDDRVGPDVWSDGFTPERFVDFLVDALLVQLRGQGEGMDCLLTVVRRVLYAAD